MEPMLDDLVQRVRTTNADNLVAVGRRPVNVAKAPTIFMARSEVEAMLRREKERPPCL